MDEEVPLPAVVVDSVDEVPAEDVVVAEAVMAASSAVNRVTSPGNAHKAAAVAAATVAATNVVKRDTSPEIAPRVVAVDVSTAERTVTCPESAPQEAAAVASEAVVEVEVVTAAAEGAAEGAAEVVVDSHPEGDQAFRISPAPRRALMIKCSV